MNIVVAALIWAGIVVVSMLIASWLAVRWGRDPFGWVLLSAVLGPIALIGLIGSRQSDIERPAPLERQGANAAGQHCILAAADGSESSVHVARYIASVHRDASEVVLLAVLPQEARPPGGGAAGGEHARRVSGMVSAAEKILAEAGTSTRVVVGYGSPGETIVRAAEEEGADVVVVGRRGNGLTKALLGSTSDYVVKHSKRPVAVVD